MIYLADILHVSGPDPMHPSWDSMVTLKNDSALALTARLQIWNEDTGLPVMWLNGVADHFDIVLESGRLWAASFLPDNGFGPTPPQDFKGHGTIDCFVPTPFGNQDHTQDVLPFMLLANNAWRRGVNAPVTTSISAKTRWVLPYAIPHFDDRSGATATLWVTGFSVQNFSPTPATVTLTYTVAQTYAESGQAYHFVFTVPANGGVRFDMMAGNPAKNIPGLGASGYPE